MLGFHHLVVKFNPKLQSPFCYFAILPSGLPKWTSSCPQINLFLGCSRPECFFFSLPKILPQKIKLPLVFFVFSTGCLSLPSLSPSFSLFSLFFYLVGLWSLRGAMVSKFKLPPKLFFEHIESKLTAFDFKFHVFFF